MNREKDAARYEAAQNNAADVFFNARPSLARNVESEYVFAGGFRLAWEADDRSKQLESLLRRYRTEVPLGHQPHMTAHIVDKVLSL